MTNKASTSDIEKHVKQWLAEVVIGLQLCPFAKAPFNKQQIRFYISKAETEEVLIDDLIRECQYLDDHATTETTLIICPNILDDFFMYNQFLLWAGRMLKQHQWEGVYQIASFHPDYTFFGIEADAPQNLTNRSPYPILHLLREDSLADILDRYSDPEGIPEKNIKTMEALSTEEKRRYFSYLYE